MSPKSPTPTRGPVPQREELQTGFARRRQQPGDGGATEATRPVTWGKLRGCKKQSFKREYP